MNRKALNQMAAIDTYRIRINRYMLMPAQLVLITSKLFGTTTHWGIILIPLWLMGALLATEVLVLFWRALSTAPQTPAAQPVNDQANR